MALKNLTLAEMIGVSGHILSTEGLRPQFEESPLLAAQLEGIEEVHRQVAAATTAPGDTHDDKVLAALSAEGNDLDVNHHDRLVRGLFYVLAGVGEIIPERAGELATLSVRLLPQGLATSQQTWRGESGNCTRVGAELVADEALHATLASFTLPEKLTLLDVVERFVAAGTRLGLVEARRDEIRAKLKGAVASESAAEPVEALTVAAARNEWIATLNGLVTTLRLPRSKVEASTRDKVLTLIGEAERRADLRNRRGTVTIDEGDAPQPVPPVTPVAPVRGATEPQPA
jgi:hypothetical protein